MLDRRDIDLRFLSCYADKTCYAMAKEFGVHQSLPYQWQEGKAHVPWHRLKALVDQQNISWDWLMEGTKPKHRKIDAGQTTAPLNRKQINDRFLSLFAGLSQAKIGEELGGINPGTVYKWRHYAAQVPWERLKYAVDNKGVTWEWLIEGC